jgi:hypothetical protein
MPAQSVKHDGPQWGQTTESDKIIRKNNKIISGGGGRAPKRILDDKRPSGSLIFCCSRIDLWNESPPIGTYPIV